MYGFSYRLLSNHSLQLNTFQPTVRKQGSSDGLESCCCYYCWCRVAQYYIAALCAWRKAQRRKPALLLGLGPPATPRRRRAVSPSPSRNAATTALPPPPSPRHHQLSAAFTDGAELTITNIPLTCLLSYILLASLRPVVSYDVRAVLISTVAALGSV